MDYTEDRTEKKTITVIVKYVSMFKILCWYNQGHDDQNIAENIDIRCSNRGK